MPPAPWRDDDPTPRRFPRLTGDVSRLDGGRRPAEMRGRPTDEEREEIRRNLVIAAAHHLGGVPQRMLAIVFKMSQPRICQICRQYVPLDAS